MEKWSVLVVSPLTDVKVQTFREVFFFKADATQLKCIYRTHVKTTTVDQSAVQSKIAKALIIYYLFQKLIIYQAILYCLEDALNIHNIHNIRTAI